MGDGIGTEIGGNGILMMDVPSSDQDTTVHQNESCPDQDKSWMCMPITFLLLGEKLQEPEQRGEPIEPDDGLPGKGTTPVMVVNLRPGPCITQFDPKSGEVHLWYKS